MIYSTTVRVRSIFHADVVACKIRIFFHLHQRASEIHAQNIIATEKYYFYNIRC